MKKIGLTIITLCFISGLVVASASAKMGGAMGSGGGMGMRDGAHAIHIVSALGLDDNQSKEVKNVILKLQKALIQKRAEIQVAEIELSEILDKDTVDTKVAETKVKQIASLKTEAAMMHIQGIEDIKANLTPEQKKKLPEMMQMKHGKGMMDCPMMKGMMNMGPDTGDTDAKPAKNKSKKAAPPAHQQNQ
jgi:Spy/CpxP family protein refolding chaperone